MGGAIVFFTAKINPNQLLILIDTNHHQGSHLTPNQQSQTPIFGLELQLFMKNLTKLLSKSVHGTPVLKILVRTLHHCSAVNHFTGKFFCTATAGQITDLLEMLCCFCNPFLVTMFPEWLSSTEPWPHTPGTMCQFLCF